MNLGPNSFSIHTFEFHDDHYETTLRELQPK